MWTSLSLLLLPLALAHNPFFKPHKHPKLEDVFQATAEEQRLALESARLEAAKALAAQAAAGHSGHGAAGHGKMYERGDGVELDERGMPITATTTIMVQMTTTQTVWVRPTDQAHFGAGDSATTTAAQGSASTSLPVTHSASASATAQPISSSSSDSSAGQASSTSAVPSASASSSSSAPLSHSSAFLSHSSVFVSASSAPIWPSQSASSAVTTTSSSSHESSSTDTASSSATATLSTSHSSASSTVPSSASSPISSSVSSNSSSSSASASHTHSESSSSVSASITATASASASSANATMSSTSTAANTTSLASSTISSVASSAIASSAIASMNASTIASSTAPASTIASSTAASSTASAPVASSTAPVHLEPVPRTFMAGYYPDWSGGYLTPEDVDFSRFDVIDFAFALPTASGGLQFTQWDSSDLLTRLVKCAHAAGKHVKLSIGGWTGSTYFSTLFADPGLRATFVSNILAAYNTYNLDGIDIDWEYPGGGGAWGNSASSDDSANYVLFLQQLRAALPSNAYISLCTQDFPFAGPNNSGPLTDVSAFANIIDYILIMNYDVWGSSDSAPGPNAPLSNACGNSTQPLASAYAAVASWTTAGMPASKITLGLPAYGYLQKSWATHLIQKKRDWPVPPHKRSNTSLDERATVTLTNDNGGTSDGQIAFNALVQQGALWRDGNGVFQAGGGFVREWDACSSTPWLKSWDSGQIVTYDDPQSLSLKAQFAAQAGLRGCNIWSIDSDYMNGNWYLTDAVRSGLGLS